MNEGRIKGRTHGAVLVWSTLLSTAVVFSWGFVTSGEQNFANDQHVRIVAAMHDLKARRLLEKKGVPVHVTFPDGTARDITLNERSDAFSSEESVGFYDLPTNTEILAHWGVAGYATLGAPSEKKLAYTPRYDKNAVEKYLAQYFDQELHGPTSARFIVENGRVRVSDEAPGQDFAYSEFYERLDTELSTLARDEIALDAVPTPAAINADDLRPRGAFFDKLLGGPAITIRYDGRSWSIDMKKFIETLTSIGTSTKQLGLTSTEVQRMVSAESFSLIKSPVVEPRFSFDGDKIIQVKSGAAGQEFSYTDLASSLSKWLDQNEKNFGHGGALLTMRPSFNLTVKKSEPEITTDALTRMGVVSRIGIARTSFKGSSKDRIHNITLGASRVTGRFVMPGEEYSLVKAIGYAEKENGYREEYVIKGNRSKKEAGGGLCQVATTFFRTMINAGLPVTERHNHRYVVGYYGPGLDATIYDVSVDLKFKNDTSAPILVQVGVSGNELIVEFYGKPDGRIALTSNPIISSKIPAPATRYLYTSELPLGQQRCVEHSREGMSAYANTRVHYSDGTSRIYDWYSEYTPWAQVCLIGAPWGTEELPK